MSWSFKEHETHDSVHKRSGKIVKFPKGCFCEESATAHGNQCVQDEIVYLYGALKKVLQISRYSSV